MAIIGDDCEWHLHYKAGIALALARVINYTPCVMLQTVTSLADDYRGVIHNFYMFLMQGTESN